MKSYDKLWIMATLMGIWDLIRYGQTGSDIRLILAYSLFFVGIFFFLYGMHLDNMERK